MGNEISINKKKDPCYKVLGEYIKCMEVHEGVKPELYEPEFCTIEKEAYRDCRSQLSGSNQKDIK
jgi:hypothetical protein|tara:strand:- start:207 stop:401 length:195 start_codon:yes stop_codon:yes gene_type:complete